MKFHIVKDYDEMSRKAAEFVIDEIKSNPHMVLGLATGSTPVGMYKCLIKECKKGLNFSGLSTFNLDEYYGISPEHTQSYRYFMEKNLFDHINIDKNKIHIPNGVCQDIDEECSNYDKSIMAAGGIDIQVLGIGRNGHIGFNEPDDMLEVKTHITDLTEDTIKANSRFFNSIDEVPKQAITMGLGTIMKAKRILLLASGFDKAHVIEKIAQPLINTCVPASILHLHNNVTVIVDNEAASLINFHDQESIAV